MNDIVERLRKIEALKPGDMVPPELYDNSGSWAVLMSKLCGDGADEIERLRAQVADLTRLAGCAAVGKEFAEIKQSLPHSSNWDMGAPGVITLSYEDAIAAVRAGIKAGEALEKEMKND